MSALLKCQSLKTAVSVGSAERRPVASKGFFAAKPWLCPGLMVLNSRVGMSGIHSASS